MKAAAGAMRLVISQKKMLSEPPNFQRDSA